MLSVLSALEIWSSHHVIWNHKWSEMCTRSDLRRSKNQTFSGGVCPQTPLEGMFLRIVPWPPQIFSKYRFAPLVYFSKWNAAHPGVHFITPWYTVMTYSQWHDLHLSFPTSGSNKNLYVCLYVDIVNILLKLTRQTYHGLVCCRWLALTVCRMNTSLCIIKMHILGRVYGPIARLLE